MEKVKILAIAPYEELRFSLVEASHHRNDVELTVYVGNMAKGVEIVESLSPDSFDVILSRGGTAKMIREATGYPTVEISISVYDIMRALRFAQNIPQRYAIVGFPNITNAAYLLNELMQNNVEIASIRSSEEAIHVMQKMKEEGYQMIIGDLITCDLAQQTGLGYILITSGSEAIENAFDMAVQQCIIGQNYKRQLVSLTSIMNKWDFQALVYNQARQEVVNTLRPETARALGDMKSRLVQLKEKGHLSFVRSGPDKETQYSVEAELLRSEGEECLYAFHVTLQYSSKYQGLEYIDEKSAELRYMNSYAGVSQQTRENFLVRKQYVSSANHPVLILGERGTGKDGLAYSLYLQSFYRNIPMLLADCAAVQEKGWKYIFYQSKSPLHNGRCVIYFKNCSAMPRHYALLLIEWLESGTMTAAKSMLFSDVLPLSGTYENYPLTDWLMNNSACIKAPLKPLRDMQHEFQNTAQFFIRLMNREYGKTIIGLEPEAMEMLKNFSWPENYRQLKRVLSQAVLWTDGNLISRNTVRAALLSEEKAAPAAPDLSPLFAEGKTLRDIERAAVHAVLKQMNNNQSRAARSLGISRSTLWRILKGDR